MASSSQDRGPRARQILIKSAAAIAVTMAMVACSSAAAAENPDGRNAPRAASSAAPTADGSRDPGARDSARGAGADRGNNAGRGNAGGGGGNAGGGGGNAGGGGGGGGDGGGGGGNADAGGGNAAGGDAGGGNVGQDGVGGPIAPGAPNNGLDVLARDCGKSRLQPHDGFEKAPRCVSTAFGEVTSADKSPSLLITSAPQTARSGEPFQMTVSTRNLVRDRFLGAAAGGYYLESSVLDGSGLQRGHFHTACRMLASTDVAPDAAPAPAFFLATQDNGGGAQPDTVTIDVTGLPAGTAQCSVWAGDGSHRIPMMQRANQTPAFDSVRIQVR